MSSQPNAYQNPNEIPSKDLPPKKSGGCLKGCLIVLVVMVVLCGVGGWWAYTYLPGIAIGQVRNGIVQAINESELAPQDKQEIVQQIDRVVDKYKSGEINSQDLINVMTELGQSPVFASFMVYAMEEKYIKPSGLSEEEKTAARRTLERVMRGIVEKKIKPDELDISDVSTSDAAGKQKLKDKVTDEELRACLDKLAAQADAKEIPDEPFEVRIGEEFRKAVDKALSAHGVEAKEEHDHEHDHAHDDEHGKGE